jgi:hypothetical protein
MTDRDMTPDELEQFEEERVKGRDRLREDRRSGDEDDPLLDVEPGDEDGLPDDRAPFRVPS